MPFHSRLDPAIRPILKDGLPDGRNVLFLEPVVFVRATDMRRFRIPVGATTDGASTPGIVWPILPPEGRSYWLATALHDACYRGTLETSDDGLYWVAANLDQQASDDLLLESMIALGVDHVTRETIYQALRAFGAKAFREDRAAKADAVVPAVVPPVPPALK